MSWQDGYEGPQAFEKEFKEQAQEMKDLKARLKL
jgi:hypothetical protein